MKQYEKVFDALYYNMVEAGETGGILDTILQRLSSYIEKNVKLKRAVKSAMVYPIAVLGIAAGVIILLLWKVVPIFSHFVQRLGRGPAAAHAHRHRAQQLRRQHLRLPDSGGLCRRTGFALKILVRHAAGPHGHRHRCC